SNHAGVYVANVRYLEWIRVGIFGDDYFALIGLWLGGGSVHDQRHQGFVAERYVDEARAGNTHFLGLVAKFFTQSTGQLLGHLARVTLESPGQLQCHVGGIIAELFIRPGQLGSYPNTEYLLYNTS